MRPGKLVEVLCPLDRSAINVAVWVMPNSADDICYCVTGRLFATRLTLETCLGLLSLALPNTRLSTALLVEAIQGVVVEVVE